MPLNPQDLVRLRAELLRHVDSERNADAAVPFDPKKLLGSLAAELEAARLVMDPVPQAPFASHRHRTAWLVRGAKELGAWLMRPFARFLFQRQADSNRRTPGHVSGLEGARGLEQQRRVVGCGGSALHVSRGPSVAAGFGVDPSRSNDKFTAAARAGVSMATQQHSRRAPVT